MKPLSASQAAKAVGKSIPTITRAIKSGKMTAETLEGGGYKIEPSELFRVWPAVTSYPDAQGNALGRESTQLNKALQAKSDELHELKLGHALEKIKELETERDKWQSQAERALLLLSNQSAAQAAASAPVAAPERLTLWQFLGLAKR